MKGEESIYEQREGKNETVMKKELERWFQHVHVPSYALDTIVTLRYHAGTSVINDDPGV